MNYLVNIMIFLPLLGGIICLLQGKKENARIAAFVFSVATFALSAIVGYAYYGTQAVAGANSVQFETAFLWIKHINVYYRTGVDGMSMPLVLLSTGVSILVVWAAFSIEKNVNIFMGLYMMLLSGMLGVFLSMDMILFYVFFEVSLLPMYFLIGIWGGPRREYAAIKFFLYTLAGSICLLVTMMGLYFFTGEAAGSNGLNTWAMVSAVEGQLTLQSEAVRSLFTLEGAHGTFGMWAFWLTLIAFMVKLPAVPFHTWLPDAHVQAPTPISMILAGVLLKMGGYALMRITYPFFPEAAAYFWFPVALLGVIAIVYGAFCAIAQHLTAECDWKKLVAYSSVSHMGFVTLGLAVMNETAFNGAYYQMIGHGIGSALMFFLVGVVYERAHRRDMGSFKGLWLHWPSYGGWSLVGFFAGLGLPGLCGFIGEIMVFLGVFQAGSPTGVGANSVTAVWALGITAATGVVLTAGYILWMFQRVYMGEPKEEYNSFAPITARENMIMASLGILAIIFGIFPFLVFDLTDNTVEGLFNIFNGAIKSVLAIAG